MAEPKRQVADDRMKEGWLSSLMARVSPKAQTKLPHFVWLPRIPCTKSCIPLPQRLNLPRNALGMQAARGVSSPNTVMHL
jgi:hypothetical protein